MNKNKKSGGLAQGKTLTDIANMHKVDIDDLTKQLQKGIKVEMEHTSDTKKSEEIALDHLFEDPKYYDKLATIENESVNEAKHWGKMMKAVRSGDRGGTWTIVAIGDSPRRVVDQRIVNIEQAIPAHFEDMKLKHPRARISIEDKGGRIVYTESIEDKLLIKNLLREGIETTIVDESPDTIQVLAKYNGRNAGVISVTAAKTKDTMEIVGVQFLEDYHTLFILTQAVKSLWQIFSGTNALIVAPKPEGIAAWNKIGFQRISKNYLILNRGH
jgi:hypothetical protein